MQDDAACSMQLAASSCFNSTLSTKLTLLLLQLGTTTAVVWGQYQSMVAALPFQEPMRMHQKCELPQRISVCSEQTASPTQMIESKQAMMVRKCQKSLTRN
jgi:hypothetical protein